MTRSRQQRSLSFGAEAAAYERGRPSYPPEAIDWLLPANAQRRARPRRRYRQADHPARRARARRGRGRSDPGDARAAEPSLPDTPALLGTAEEIPLPDDSVDAVLVAQAWHWFDPERAVKEVARVLRPGRTARAWCGTPATSGWAGSRTSAASSATRTTRSTTRSRCRSRSTDVERHQVEWTSYLTPQALIDLVASRSYCITSPADVRTQTLERVRELLATHPGAGQHHRAGAALRHGGHPRDAALVASRGGTRSGRPRRPVTHVVADATHQVTEDADILIGQRAVQEFPDDLDVAG